MCIFAIIGAKIQKLKQDFGICGVYGEKKLRNYEKCHYMPCVAFVVGFGGDAVNRPIVATVECDFQ